MPEKKLPKKQNTNKEEKSQSNISKSQTDSAASTLAELETQISSQKVDIEFWKNKSLRLSADIQNLQKQSDLDILQAKKTSKKQLIQNILPFINTLNIAFAYVPQTDDQKVSIFVETLKNTFEKLKLDLVNSNIEIIGASTGDIFNPDFMNILNSDYQNSDSQPVIKQVVSVGLRVDGQLIQPLSVIVG